MQSHYWKIVIVFLALVSCQTKNPNEFDFSKLIGRWEYTDPKSHQIEQWNSESDSSLVGKGFVLEQGDTTFIEFLALKKINGVWNYIAQVPSQNEQKEVYFCSNDCIFSHFTVLIVSKAAHERSKDFQKPTH